MATRYERVVLDIESKLAPVMARDAAAAKFLERSLNDLDGTSAKTSRSMSPLGDPNGPVASTGKQSSAAGKEIDRLSGRLRLLADTAAILGPALIPIGAVGIPAVAGLAAQLGAAALAGGTAIIAFQGVGDALKAVNKAALEPTAENLEAARIAMERIGPEAQAFVAQVREMVPAFQQVRNAAAAGLFPGVTKSLDELEAVLPQVEDIVYRIGDAMGDLSRDAAKSLAGPEWADFLGFVENEIPTALTDLGHIVGNLAHGMAELWMAFDPLNDDFSSWLRDASEAFDDWARGLSQSGGFQEFIDYVRENGPKVADAMGSIGNALLKIVEAAAPLGGPTLDALAAVADVIAAIADSDAGPAIMATVTALALLNRSMKAFEAVSSTSWATSIRGAETFAGKMQAAQTPLRRGAGALAGLAIATTGVADGFGLSNTASLALLGTLGGPWGAAVGGAVGLALDFGQSQRESAIDVDGLTATLNQQTGAITENTKVWAAKQLEEDGLLSKAQQMGLNLSMVADAALGQADAVEQVNEQLDAFIDAGYSADQNSPGYGAMVELGTAAEDLRDRLGNIRGELDSGQAGLQRVAAASARTAEGFHQAKSAAQEFREEMERVNAVLEKRANMRDYQAALDDFADTLDDVKNKAKLLTKDGKINIDLPKGREVQAALDNIAQTATKVAENLKGIDRQKYLVQARKDFIDAATDLGLTRKAANFLASELGLLDRANANPRVQVLGVDEAVHGVDRVQAEMGALRDKTVTITVHTQRSGAGLDYVSGGQPRITTPRSTTTPVTTPATFGKVLSTTSIVNARALGATAALAATAELARTATAAKEATFGLSSLANMSVRELHEREQLLAKELEHAQKRRDAELEELRALKDARRSLAQQTSSNFTSDLFGEGASLSSIMLTLSNNSIQASEFQSLLRKLARLGLDGGAYAELAASGNMGAAQSILAGGVGGINALEAAYQDRVQLAQGVGQFAGSQVWGAAIKDQTQEARASRRVVERLEAETKHLRREIRQVEKAVHDEGAKATGRAVGREINGAAATGHKRRKRA